MNQIYTVSQVNSYVKGMFARDAALANIAIKGEISNCTYHSSGHIYFTLKDKGGRLSCVMFAGSRRGLDFTMKDGMGIVVVGNIGVYERDGKYQLYALRIMREGYGELYEKLEILKKKLSDEGLFSDVNKKKIPYYSRKIGIVTAPGAAALQDIITVSMRRNPYVGLYLYPAVVQGVEAAESIAHAVSRIDKMGMDVLIVGRGGGSFEDLFAFNEEIVVRAIYNCKTPVISAVGHDVDTTLSDFAADLRAATPSAAAELAVAGITDILAEIDGYKGILLRNMQKIIADNRITAERYFTRIRYAGPQMNIESRKIYADELAQRIERIMKDKLESYRVRLMLCAEKLKVLSPLHRLSGGYSYVTDSGGAALTSVAQAGIGDNITVTLKDGSIKAGVIEVKEQDNGEA